GRAPATDRPGAGRGGRRARHGFHPALRQPRHRPAPGQGPLGGLDRAGAGRPEGAGRVFGNGRRGRPGRGGLMLELTDIEAGYGPTRVLHGVSLTAPDGVTAILGHNGAGKTTLMRAVIGLIRPTKGRVVFDGKDITSLAPNARVAQGMAYVPQGQQSFTQLSTMENLQL